MIYVCDAGPILHLHWVDASNWALPAEECLVPEAVWQEITRHDPQALLYPQLRRVPDPAPDPRIAPGSLDPGEVSALSLAALYSGHDSVLLLCDEVRGRTACRAWGLAVIGTVGLIVEAAAAGSVSRSAAESALRDLPVRGKCWLASAVIDEAVKRVRSCAAD